MKQIKCWSVLISSVLVMQVASASSACQFYDVRCIGSRAGEEAAQKVVKAAEAAERASRNIPLAINQFGLLIDEYHSTDEAKRAHARRIVQNVFPGVARDPSPTLHFSGSLDFADIDPQKELVADIRYIDTPAQLDRLREQIAAGTAFKPEIISPGTTNPPATLDQVEDRIREHVRRALIDQTEEPPGAPTWLQRTCAGAPDMKSIGKCMTKARTEQLVAAILGVTQSSSDRQLAKTFSRAYKGGGYAVVLIPIEQFSQHPKMKLFFRLHTADDPRKTAKDFETPHPVSMEHMGINQMKTNDPQYKAFRYAIIDLRVSDYF